MYVFYSPASMDSVITAAWLMSSLHSSLNPVAVQAFAGSYVPHDAEDNLCVFVDVEPLKRLSKPGSENFVIRKKYPLISLEGAQPAPIPGRPKLIVDGHIFSDENTLCLEQVFSAGSTFMSGEALRGWMCSGDAEKKKVARSIVAPIADAIRSFDNCEKRIPMSTQVMLFKVYRNAMRVLHGIDNKFELIPNVDVFFTHITGSPKAELPFKDGWTPLGTDKLHVGGTLKYDQDTKEYLEFLSEVKNSVYRSISLNEEVTYVGFRKKMIIQYPFMSVPSEIMPFALKLVTNVYDTVVSAEMSRGYDVYTVFSRNPEKKQLLEKFLFSNKNSYPHGVMV